MISVVGSRECESATIESDEWIPLSIAWNPRTQGQLLYLMVSGTSGGYVELKVEALTGMLVEVVVIDPPPETTPLTQTPSPQSVTAQSPAIDTSAWDWQDTPDGRAPNKSIVDIAEELHFTSTPHGMELTFSDARIGTQYHCGDVTTSISDDSHLVAISIRVDERDA